ncbi:MAG: hypothetical protein ABI137_10440 [Antricoccus sp.]
MGQQVRWRPTRTAPRLELDDVSGTAYVHAYRHGGIGVTVFWGVADDWIGIQRLMSIIRLSILIRDTARYAKSIHEAVQRT